jgi:endonuclease/exonuclease/phosphatase family metal-dependent hydrolase
MAGRSNTTMNRREFWKTGGMLGAALAVSETVRAAEDDAPFPTFTSIAYNILACRGYPDTEGNRARRTAVGEHMAERMALELALYGPDVVTFSESPPEAIVARIAAALEMNYAWFESGWPGNDEYPGGFPGTILSRYPITAKENCPTADGGARPEDLFTRHWCRATLETEAGPLAVFSAHLHPSDDEIRAREIAEILKVIGPDLEAGRSLVLQGDLNHTPEGPEYARWVEAGLTDTFSTREQRHRFTFSSIAPDARIDYIWAAGPLAESVTEARVLFEGAYRTNPDDPTSFALSDHVPVLARFGAPPR